MSPCDTLPVYQERWKEWIMTAMSDISPDVGAQFEAEGFSVARGLFSADEVAAIRDAFMDAAGNGPVQGLSEITRNGTGQSYDASDPLAFYPRMMHPHRHPHLPAGQLARRFMLDARLHGPLRACMKDEPVAVQSMFYFKPPGARGQDLHQDNFYLRVKPGTCCAAWLAIDDADRGNGGMVVVPGTQHMEIVCPKPADKSRFFTDHHVPVPPGLKEVPVDLKAGDVLFFNGSLVHGSYPNTSRDRFRRSLIFHYVPGSAKELAKWYQDRLLFNGETVHFDEATGGGPCGGDFQPLRPH
jgi:phytanoyl-CoA hydroxylase